MYVCKFIYVNVCKCTYRYISKRQEKLRSFRISGWATTIQTPSSSSSVCFRTWGWSPNGYGTGPNSLVHILIKYGPFISIPHFGKSNWGVSKNRGLCSGPQIEGNDAARRLVVFLFFEAFSALPIALRTSASPVWAMQSVANRSGAGASQAINLRAISGFFSQSKDLKRCFFGRHAHT